ncbi:MAG: hypothetical protein GX661_05810 [Acholeplasmataceae bacterium]|nr:hypothetical protein [Acholeplasmataceae bacterium]
MKKLAIVAIFFGLLALIGISFISAKSQDIESSLKTWGFVVLGYLGVISFAWGWMKIFRKK